MTQENDNRIITQGILLSKQLSINTPVLFLGLTMDPNAYGEAVRLARIRQKMTQVELAALVGITQGMVAHIETGRRQPDVDTALKIERALKISQGTLSSHLPESHGVNLANSVSIIMAGTVGVGPPSVAEGEYGEMLSVGQEFANCIAYRVRGSSMTEEHIQDGDFIIVRPGVEVKSGDIVVAWVEGEGCVCKKLQRGKLRSPDGWAHTLSPGDHVYGKLVAVYRRYH
ncbi:LexA family protein [Tuwongella immobilis]|uniref:HTH cro/C1-type domain-containing protein n=1 Tax=Tuwongella immobilis TaxID=692036 RepID=A0A6C2YNG4_9BACT|nr:S24 family peptidase [Tuwongella immobilis]VIP02976.1 sos-response transcriptional repressors (-mediated autopeptidases) : SOS-response transcriptional repressors (RecA-mediated autopeptidases) OS=Faecalibacterium sp. CAG:82 GN=BN792_01821 PE=4 SV=1: HTH_3: Peptidase_S24 [Tuwongella immobilis]VTS03016.1 sos-response transcriptional repressors (-mediated autopeptidases) : SOS-response transcriptional repressors (RecA-mediated autopeptidases) OS=Faecalibacterium sp. CAG:82 GN=BN792_01821 PE=4 SV